MSIDKMVKKLPKINFEKKKGKRVPWAHCYVEKSEFKTKGEQKDIAEDTKRFRFTYRNKKYTKKEV